MNKKDKKLVSKYYDELMKENVPDQDNFSKIRSALTFENKKTNLNFSRRVRLSYVVSSIIIFIVGLSIGLGIIQIRHIKCIEEQEIISSSMKDDLYKKKSIDDIEYLKENGLFDKYVGYLPNVDLFNSIVTVFIGNENFDQTTQEIPKKNNNYNAHLVIVDNIDYLIFIEAGMKVCKENEKSFIKLQSALPYSYNDLIDIFANYSTDTINNYLLEDEETGIAVSLGSNGDFFYTFKTQEKTYLLKYINGKFEIIG